MDILSTLRVPFVQLRLLIETPALWGLALAAAVLFDLAWVHDRRDRDGARSAKLIEVLRPRQVVVLVQIGVLTASLAAVRLAPAVATFGTGANTFISGFPTAASMFESLAGTPVRRALLDQWELETYVGGMGLILLGIGAVPFGEIGKQHLNLLLLPSAASIILSFGAPRPGGLTPVRRLVREQSSQPWSM